MSNNIIGIDFGNYNTLPSVITDLKEGTRIGGIAHDLLPTVSGTSYLSDGIPSVFFHSKKRGDLCGESALGTRATPMENRKRYLKRHLGETFRIDGDLISCDYAIIKLFEYVMERANIRLHQNFQVMTNQIYLAYPATFGYQKREYLKNLVEQAKVTIDGKEMNVKVMGTIAEPAAAALDYLSEFASKKDVTTVLTLDCGGGTTDAALLAAYPKGKKNAQGNTIYYDMIDPSGGIPDLGGKEFDEVVANLILEQFKKKYPNDYPVIQKYFSTERGKVKLLDKAESIKKELGENTMAVAEFQITAIDEEFFDVDITKKMFNDAILKSGLIKKITDLVNRMIQNHPNQKPDLIVLTGGSCQMPIMLEEMQKAFPAYKDKIKTYRPSRAISYGAARFGAVEGNPDGKKVSTIIQNRLPFDIGAHFYNGVDDKKGYIETYLKKGTEIPCESTWHSSYTIADNVQISHISTYEAIVDKPDTNEPNRDYRFVMNVDIDHGKKVPKGTYHSSRIRVDKFGVVEFEVIEKDHPERISKVKQTLASLKKG